MCLYTWGPWLQAQLPSDPPKRKLLSRYSSHSQDGHCQHPLSICMCTRMYVHTPTHPIPIVINARVWSLCRNNLRKCNLRRGKVNFGSQFLRACGGRVHHSQRWLKLLIHGIQEAKTQRGTEVPIFHLRWCPQCPNFLLMDPFPKGSKPPDSTIVWEPSTHGLWGDIPSPESQKVKLTIYLLKSLLTVLVAV